MGQAKQRGADKVRDAAAQQEMEQRRRHAALAQRMVASDELLLRAAARETDGALAMVEALRHQYQAIADSIDHEPLQSHISLRRETGGQRRVLLGICSEVDGEAAGLLLSLGADDLLDLTTRCLTALGMRPAHALGQVLMLEAAIAEQQKTQEG